MSRYALIWFIICVSSDMFYLVSDVVCVVMCCVLCVVFCLWCYDLLYVCVVLIWFAWCGVVWCGFVLLLLGCYVWFVVHWWCCFLVGSVMVC